MSIVTLLTDFGTKDEYVGVMRGVILSIDPCAVIVDISHHIRPQDTVQAALMVRAVYPFFPPGTVHVIVVDPGVGSQRDILALRAARQTFVAPDNGVLSALLTEEEIASAVRVTETRYFLKPLSDTFHGRDIFAPVAGHLSSGVLLEALGPAIAAKRALRLDMPKAGISDTGDLVGSVTAVDRFGNLITSVGAETISVFCPVHMQPALSIRIGTHEVSGISASYSSVPPGRPLAIIGSRGFLEISVNLGDASGYFSVGYGDPVRLVCPGSV